MATYVNDLRLKEISTGDESGTWGTSTNTSLELIGEALGYATQQVFGSDADATTTIADGASDPARAMYFKITSAGSLTATRTCTIAPNTVSRVMFIENATTGSQSIAISQGSGANVTIATGKTAVVYLDGAGSGAAVVDAMAGVDPGVTDTLAEVLTAGNTTTTDQKIQFRDAAIYINSSADGQLDIVADTEIQIAATTIDINGTLAFDSLKGTGATTVTNILDEDNMASDSATAIATQQSIKAYVDSQVGSFDTLAEVLAQGNTTGGTDLAVSTGDDITFADSSKAIFGAGSDLQIYHDPSGPSSIISDQGAGDLILRGSNQIRFQDATGGEHYAIFNENGAVQLNYDNAGKLSTTATGIDVTGSVTATTAEVGSGTDGVKLTYSAGNSTGIVDTGFTSTGIEIRTGNVQRMLVNSTGIDVTGGITATVTDNTDVLTLISTDADENSGPRLALTRNSASPADNDYVGLIAFNGENSADESIRMGMIRAQVLDVTDGTEDSTLTFYSRHGGTETQRLATTATGIDVTGSVTADSLIVDGSLGQIALQSSGAELHFSRNGNNDLLANGGSSAALTIGANDNVRFLTGSTERMRIDASGSVGIGTSSPVVKLSVKSSQEQLTLSEGDARGATFDYRSSTGNLNIATNGANARTNPQFTLDLNGNVGIGTSSDLFDVLTVDDTNPKISMRDSGTERAFFEVDSSDNFVINNKSASAMILETSDTERMRIDASGNVGIGVTASGVKLEVLATVSDNLVARFENNHATGSYGISVKAGDDSGNYAADFANKSGTSLMRIRGDGNVGIGTTLPAAPLDIKLSGDATADIFKFQRSDGLVAGVLNYNGTDGAISLGTTTAHPLAFDTNNVERMRIDASGNLLVGQTTNTTTGTGIGFVPDGTSHMYSASTDALMLGRGGSDGEILSFNKSGATVGSIGTRSDLLKIGSGDTGITFNPTNDSIFPEDMGGTFRDAAIDLGVDAARFRNLRLSGGVYLGGTAAANKLDDYEEGTWTPVIAGGTCTNMTGKYTKVGNQVTVILAVVNGNLAGTSGNVITGLPFTSTTRSTAGAVAFYNIFSVDDPVGYLGAGVTSINFIQNTASSAWSTANFSNSAATYFHFSLTYFV